MINQPFIAQKIWIPLMMVVLLAGCQPARFTEGTTTEVDSIADCYRVEFLDVTAISEVATTWSYRVGQPSCANEVSSWMLELPACATVVDASPAAWEIVSPDLNYQLNGIKWPSSTDFQNGEFSVTLLGDLDEGMTRAGVERQDIFMESVKGPVCKELASVPTATVSAPIAKVKVQSANCRAMPVGKAQKVTLLYRSQETEIIGRNGDPNNPWWYVKIPGQEGNCWLWGRTVTATGNVDTLPIIR